MSVMDDARDRVLRYEADLFSAIKAKNTPEKSLNLGCGMRILDGFTNVDKYVIYPRIVNYDVYQLPYENDSIDLIFSAHSLEHLPIRHAKMALIDWYRVLDYGGKLVLMVPNLKTIMLRLLDDESLAEQEYNWYLYTLFGYQINTNNRDDRLDYPLDMGQFHTCGFTENKLKRELVGLGFKITEMFSYDGWKTPSIFVEASK